MPGPGAEFFRAVQKELGGLPFIAEDLGLITPDVYALRDQFHIPGTKVLQFAFDGHLDNPYLPDNYVSNAVVYTGTHDNNTTRGWYEDSSDSQRRTMWRYLNRQAGNEGEAAPELVVSRGGPGLRWRWLVCRVAQSGWGPDGGAGQPPWNWRWRCTDGMLSASDFQWLRDLTETSNRSFPHQSPSLSEVTP